jgi:hypothetical protein
MMAQDAYMVGTSWLRPSYPPELQEQSECQICFQTESMEHILVECTTTGQSEVWYSADTLWLKKYNSTVKPSFGNILGSPAVLFKSEDGAPDQGKSRLYRIVISESAHLIWKLRCERVIQNEGHLPSTREVKPRWIDAINARINLDRKMTNPRYGKTIKEDLVIQTWSGIIKNEGELPENWAIKAGGLVGIDLDS